MDKGLTKKGLERKSNAGRSEINPEDLKTRVVFFTEQKKIDKLGMKECERLSKVSIDEAYLKVMEAESQN